jgi:DNA-3-methyladenine glycosylase II
VTEDVSRAAWLRQARFYLRNADPVLARLIDDRPAFDPRAWMAQLPPMDLYGALLFQVTGQQLSVAATRRTLARIEALFDGHLPSPAELLGVAPEKLREAGLSWRKINTLRDLAERLSDGRLNPSILSTLPDDELMTELTAISGIGPWTVQGALIIALQREDVVLPGDLALRKAVQAAYQLDHLPSQQEVLAIAEKWRPYRSLATSYLFSAAFEPTGPAALMSVTTVDHFRVTLPPVEGAHPGANCALELVRRRQQLLQSSLRSLLSRSRRRLAALGSCLRPVQGAHETVPACFETTRFSIARLAPGRRQSDESSSQS